MHTMRRFSYSSPKRRDRGHPEGRMYSTPAESSPPAPSQYSFHDRPDTRPTIEQIAMGLHISRTPHALPHRATQPILPTNRRVSESPRPSPHTHSHLLTRPSVHTRRASMSAIVLPPPPARSSLKKSSRPPTAESSLLATSASDASLSTMTTLTSTAPPSTPRSVQSAPATSFPGKLRMEMMRLLPNRKGSLSSSVRSDSTSALTPSSDDDSATGELTPRKIVRFSTGPEPHDAPPGSA
ncbi:hypothetical protein OH77DRAFT_1498179 [Trametes cingulata]|nr:hypothetical protein OH77DRAFT_1498179 [Trametes cingulata]